MKLLPIGTKYKYCKTKAQRINDVRILKHIFTIIGINKNNQEYVTTNPISQQDDYLSFSWVNERIKEGSIKILWRNGIERAIKRRREK